jgi:hypothetical protein
VGEGGAKWVVGLAIVLGLFALGGGCSKSQKPAARPGAYPAPAVNRPAPYDAPVYGAPSGDARRRAEEARAARVQADPYEAEVRRLEGRVLPDLRRAGAPRGYLRRIEEDRRR